MPSPLTSWSFSRYSTYANCPFKAKLLYIDKMKETASPAMERGNRIHAQADNYVKRQIDEIPETLHKFAEVFESLREQHEIVETETTWAFRRDWSQTTWNDWNGCWLRVKVDASLFDIDDTTLYILDWKTGKYSPNWNLDDYLKQLELYALAGLIKFAANGPALRVIPRLYYLDAGIKHPSMGEERVYTPDMVDMLKARWEMRTQAMLSDTIFAPRPNKFCGNCSFSVKKGGPCEY